MEGKNSLPRFRAWYDPELVAIGWLAGTWRQVCEVQALRPNVRLWLRM